MHWKGSGVENANLIHKGSNFRQQINFSNDGKRTSGAFLTPKMFSHEFLIKMSVYWYYVTRDFTTNQFGVTKCRSWNLKK